MMLNESNMNDLDGIKIRPAMGLNGADDLFGMYWVWRILLDNLASVGYDSNSLYVATYDWRIPYMFLETRDKYLTRLKNEIEMRYELFGEKVIVIGHSMGANLARFFFNWVESPKAR